MVYPQGSILGPLLFNKYINNIFLFVNDTNLTNYADDNTTYSANATVDEVIYNLTKDTVTLLTWFQNNYYKMNIDKCHLFITNHQDEVSANIEGEIIEGSKSVKLLGVYIDNKLDFNDHVSNLCKKATLKLHALSRVAHYMSTDKLRLTMKAFGYCPLIWMFHSRTLNNKINRIHERALRITYNDYISSFEELLHLDRSFTIHHRNLQRLAIEMYKVKNNISPNFMKNVFPGNSNPYNLRNNSEFRSYNIHSVYNGTETISYRRPKTWSLIPNDVRHAVSLSQFKSKIKNGNQRGVCAGYVMFLFLTLV